MASTFGQKNKKRNVEAQDLDLDLQFQINGEAWKNDEIQRWYEDVMEWSTHENVQKVIMKEFEEEYKGKGTGSIWNISIPMESFKNQW